LYGTCHARSTMSVRSLRLTKPSPIYPDLIQVQRGWDEVGHCLFEQGSEGTKKL
jgi:hypothetical protein